MHQPQHDSSDLGLSPLGDAATGADVKQAFVQSRHRGKPTQCVQIEASFASLHSSALSQSVQSPQYQAPPQSQHAAFILPEVPDYGQYARDMGGRPQSYAAQRGMPAQASMPGAVCGWAAAQQPMSPHMSSPMPPPSMHQRQPSPMAPPSMHQRQPMPANSPAMYQSRPMQSPMPAWQHSTSPASMQGSPMLAAPPPPMPPPSVHGSAMHQGFGTAATSPALDAGLGQQQNAASQSYSRPILPPLQSPAAGAGNRDKAAKKTKYISRRTTAEVAAENASLWEQATQLGIPTVVNCSSSATGVDSQIPLKEFVKSETMKPTSMGGGFAVRVSKDREPGTHKGTVVELCCCEQARGCKFVVRYELCHNNTYALKSASTEHNHPLCQTQAEVMATGPGRQIPSHLDEWGETLAEAGCAAKDIYRILVTKLRRDGHADPPTFTYETVYEKYIRPLPAAHDLDAAGLVETLSAAKAEQGLEFFFEDDKQGNMLRVFAVLKGATEVWGTQRTCKIIRNVLFFDPTFGTNRFGMKLSMFVTVGPNGETIILAYMLHHEESFQDIYWGFQCFHKVFKHAPASLLTDSGAGIIKAAETIIEYGMVWQDARHLLCTYHMDQNFYDHIHRLFASNSSGWNTVHNMFWRIAKDSDQFLRDTIEERVTAMKNFIAANGKGASKAAALGWIDDVLVPKLEKWAACYTWDTFSAGAHATSRAESTNGAVKAHLLSNSSLVDLHKKLSGYGQFKEFKDACKLHTALLRRSRNSGHMTYPGFITAAKDKISAYAFDLMLGQFSQAYGYSVAPMPSDDARSDDARSEPKGSNYQVVRKEEQVGVEVERNESTGKTKSHVCKTDLGFADTCRDHWTTANYCSCQYSFSYGVLCRHSMAVRLAFPHAPSLDLSELVHERWVLESVHVEDGIDIYEPQASACEEEVAYPKTNSFNALEATMDQFLMKPNFDIPMSNFDIRTYNDTFMIMKYGTERPDQGGWHIAKMSTDGKTPGVMKLYFQFSDKRTANWKCDPQLMVSSLNPYEAHAQYSWLLLQAREPGGHAPQVSNPTSSHSAGRPQTKRHRSADPHRPLG